MTAQLVTTATTRKLDLKLIKATASYIEGLEGNLYLSASFADCYNSFCIVLGLLNTLNKGNNSYTLQERQSYQGVINEAMISIDLKKDCYPEIATIAKLIALSITSALNV